MIDDDNPLERQTEDINNREGNHDLNAVSKIVAESAQMNFTRIQEFIQQITGDPNKRFHPQSLKSQLIFLKQFYKSISTSNPSEVQFKELTEHQKFRLLQLNLNMIMKSGGTVTSIEINQIMSFLKKNPALKKQAMMKFVGCSSVLRMKSITIQEILDTTEIQVKQAIKLQIAADWKYIVEMQKQSLQFKDLAVKIWEKIGNKPTRIQECSRELNQLRQICNKKKAVTAYTKKLKGLRIIVSELSKIPDKTQAEQLKDKKRIISIALNLPSTLNKLSANENEKQKQKDDKNITQSILKKRGHIDDRRQIGAKFVARLRKNNYAYCQYVAENKFEDEQIKELFKTFGCFLKLINRKKRAVFDIFMNINTEKHIEILKKI